MPCNRVENDSRISYISGNRSNLVQRGRKGNKAITRNQAIGWLQAYQAAERSRLTDRSAGIRAQCPDCFPCCYSRCAAARRTARYIFRVPRIHGWPKIRVLGRAAHGKFIHIGLTYRHIIIGFQSFNNPCIIRRCPVFQHTGSRCTFLPSDDNVILDRSGNTGQCSNFFTCRNFSIHCRCLLQRFFIIDRKESMNIALHLLTMCNELSG